MQKNRYRRGLMLDGFTGGIGMGIGIPFSSIKTDDLTLELSNEDFIYLKNVFIECNADNVKDRLELDVQLDGTKATIQLYKSESSNTAFFNVKKCNPISFITGQNVMGSINISRQLSELYAGIEKAMKIRYENFSFPNSVWRKINNQEIFIHSIAFACYTHKLDFKDNKNLKLILDMWQVLFNTKVGDYFLNDFIKARAVREGEYSIRFDKYTGKERYFSLGIYSKTHELGDFSNLEIYDRLRFDLTLHSRWITSNRIKTIRDLTDRANGNYEMWVKSLILKVIQELRIFYAFEVPMLNNIDKGPFEKEFNEWVKNDISKDNSSDLSISCLEWFANQGLDLRLGIIPHAIIFHARKMMDIKIESAIEAAFDNNENLLKEYKDSKWAKRMISKIEKLKPDFSLEFKEEIS